MAMVNISDGCKLAGVTRTTFYKYVKAGKISVSKNGRGRPEVDTSELLRVFGSLSAVTSEQTEDNKPVQQVADKNAQLISELTAEIQVLNERLKAKDDLLEERAKRLDEMSNSIKLLENLAPRKRFLGIF